MAKILSEEQERIHAMATRVRQEQFEGCSRGPGGQCDLATTILSRNLRRMGIPHATAYGQWYKKSKFRQPPDRQRRARPLAVPGTVIRPVSRRPVRVQAHRRRR